MQNGPDRGPLTVGFDVQQAAQLPQSFPHSPNAHARPCRTVGCFLENLGQDAPSLVPHLQHDSCTRWDRLNRRPAAPRVTMDVDQGFLDDAKQNNLDLARQPSQVRGGMSNITSTSVRRV